MPESPVPDSIFKERFAGNFKSSFPAPRGLETDLKMLSKDTIRGEKGYGMGIIGNSRQS
jgi:hypothetical protein